MNQSSIKSFISENKTCAIILFFLILIVPIVFFVLSNVIICCCSTKANWFAFSGSFFGGIATLIMAFITVRITKQQITAEHKREHLKYVKANLAELFKVDYITDIFINTTSKKTIDNEEEKCRQLMLWSRFNSLESVVEINYNTLTSTAAEKDFYDAYIKLMTYCKQMTYKQAFALAIENEKLANIFAIQELMPNESEYKRLFQTAKDKAKLLIEEMENECNNIKIF